LAEKTKKIGKVAAAQWQVRDENGDIFGPVAFSALRSWVEDGRVSPLSEVSSDGEKWVLAVQVDDLEMNCVAEIEPGTFYGPIHRTAMRELITAGSISADATVYCNEKKSDSELSHVIEDLKLKIVKLSDEGASDKILIGSLQSEAANGKERIELLLKDLADGKELIESLMKDLADGKELIESLMKDVANGNERIESLQGERLNDKARIDSLQEELGSGKVLLDSMQGEIAAYQNELLELQGESEKIACKYLSEISSLNEVNDGLKSRLDVLADEEAGLRAEAESLRRNNHDHIKLMEERERLYAVELNEKESACQLKMETVILEHESAINRIKHQSVEEIHSLQASNLSLQESVKSLNAEVKALQDSNVTLEDEKRKMVDSVKKSGLSAVKEHELLSEEVAAKQREIAVLAQRIDELEQANLGLKEEFVKYEELKSRTGSNDVAQRKLIVMKNLFAEAARLLVEEESPVSEEPKSAPRDKSTEVIEPELLDYEEVPADKFEKPQSRPVVSREPVREPEIPASAPQPSQASGSKGDKKWPFGRGKKSLGHESLAELEALAQQELQRLNSSQNLSSIFDKKK